MFVIGIVAALVTMCYASIWENWWIWKSTAKKLLSHYGSWIWPTTIGIWVIPRFLYGMLCWIVENVLHKDGCHRLTNYRLFNSSGRFPESLLYYWYYANARRLSKIELVVLSACYTGIFNKCSYRQQWHMKKMIYD